MADTADLKSADPLKGREGSSPSPGTIETPIMPTLTRRHFLASAAALPFSLRALAASHSLAPRRIYIGSDTTSGAKGIYRADWNAATETLSPATLAVETPRPSYLAAHANRIYAVNALNSADAAVSSFRINPDGSLALLNSVPSGGNGPCFLSVHPTGRAAYVANYFGGSLSSFAIAANGKLSPAGSHFQYEGHGPVAARQQSPHAHSCYISPDAHWLLVNDLGLDCIHILLIDPSHPAQITPASDWHARPGSGPRHLCFAPGGRVYCINEIDSTIDLLAWNPHTGALTTVAGPYSTTAPGFTGANAAAEVLLSPDARFLYASNRGEDSITVFAINQQSGALAPIQHIPSGGRTPRHITLAPGGRTLIAANQDSSSLCIFRRNPASGELTPLPGSISVPSPMFMLFA